MNEITKHMDSQIFAELKVIKIKKLYSIKFRKVKIENEIIITS